MELVSDIAHTPTLDKPVTELGGLNTIHEYSEGVDRFSIECLPINNTICYIVQKKPLPGKFDVQKAKSLKVCLTNKNMDG